MPRGPLFRRCESGVTRLSRSIQTLPRPSTMATSSREESSRVARRETRDASGDGEDDTGKRRRRWLRHCARPTRLSLARFSFERGSNRQSINPRRGSSRERPRERVRISTGAAIRLFSRIVRPSASAISAFHLRRRYLSAGHASSRMKRSADAIASRSRRAVCGRA